MERHMFLVTCCLVMGMLATVVSAASSADSKIAVSVNPSVIQVIQGGASKVSFSLTGTGSESYTYVKLKLTITGSAKFESNGQKTLEVPIGDMNGYKDLGLFDNPAYKTAEASIVADNPSDQSSGTLVVGISYDFGGSSYSIEPISTASLQIIKTDFTDKYQGCLKERDSVKAELSSCKSALAAPTGGAIASPENETPQWDIKVLFYWKSLLCIAGVALLAYFVGKGRGRQEQRLIGSTRYQ